MGQKGAMVHPDQSQLVDKAGMRLISVAKDYAL
jgi:hypothetical protein